VRKACVRVGREVREVREEVKWVRWGKVEGRVWRVFQQISELEVRSTTIPAVCITR
jgi:hypothetical protein